MANEPGYAGYKTNPYSADFLRWLDAVSPKQQKTIDYGYLGGESGLTGEVGYQEDLRPDWIPEEIWNAAKRYERAGGSSMGSTADQADRGAWNQMLQIQQQEWLKTPTGQAWLASKGGDPEASIHGEYKRRGPSALETLTPALVFSAAALGMGAPALFGGPAAATSGAAGSAPSLAAPAIEGLTTTGGGIASGAAGTGTIGGLSTVGPVVGGTYGGTALGGMLPPALTTGGTAVPLAEGAALWDMGLTAPAATGANSVLADTAPGIASVGGGSWAGREGTKALAGLTGSDLLKTGLLGATLLQKPQKGGTKINMRPRGSQQIGTYGGMPVYAYEPDPINLGTEVTAARDPLADAASFLALPGMMEGVGGTIDNLYKKWTG